MNILMVSHYTGSLTMGMMIRPFCLAREWQKLGHKVRIVGSSFSHIRVKQPTVKADFETQVIDGVEFQWIKTCTYKNNGIARAISMVQFCGKLCVNAQRVVDEFHPDIVIGSSTYTFDTYPCQRIAKLAEAKYIHENHDIWPLSLTLNGQMGENHPFYIMTAKALKSIIKHADSIVGVLPYTYKYLELYGMVDVGKFHHIPNGIAIADWKNASCLPKEYEEFFAKMKEKFIVMYAGGHMLYYRLDKVVNAAKLVKDRDIVFVFVGQGMEKENLIAQAKKLHLDNVYFLPGVSKSTVPSVLRHADATFVCYEEDPEAAQYGASMNKVYDYMMAGKPIVFSYNSKNKEVLDAGAGIEALPFSPDVIAKKIIELKNLPPSVRKKMGENGKKWVLENCEYSVLAKKFLKVMEEC